ncbi:MAG: hypothetical protein JWP25_6925 [Bradyrhizobium sp.]|nr:hypothetical protein [Bradyrhizobium sp.]
MFLATSSALPQAGVSLVKVDLSVVSQGYRLSKLIGSSVINDKNEKIGTIDDLIADKDKKQLQFAVLQVGGFLGVGGRLSRCRMTALSSTTKDRKSRRPAPRRTN